jgi:CheY-like chemotaxis protein/HPt (histidine-containing phosphotransfer) domain-containing protein
MTPAEPTAPFAGRQTCLICDLPLTRRLLTQQLQEWGLALRVMESCQAPLPEPPPELVIIACGCAPGNFDFARSLLSTQSPPAPLVVLAIPAGCSLPLDIEHLAAGSAAHTVSLPVLAPRLYQALAAALSAPGAEQPSVSTSGKSTRAAAGHPASAAAEAPAPRTRILLADDDPVNREVLQYMLEGLGYAVVSVANGLLAVQALEQAYFPLAIIDHQMPEMDGETAIRVIRQAFPTGVQPFIIALTADARIETQQVLQVAGADIFLSKPVTRHTLSQALARNPRLSAVPQPESSAAQRSTLQHSAEHDRTLQSSTLQSSTLQDSTLPGSTLSWLDASVLADLYASLGTDNQQAHHEILDLFLDSAPKLVENIRAAAQIPDLEALSANLHALKGSCELFGAARLAARCREFEIEARAGRVNTLEDQAADLDVLFHQVYNYIADLRSGKIPPPQPSAPHPEAPQGSR